MKNPFKIRKSASGSAFTLVELIVVITILAILATIGFLALGWYAQDAKEASIKTNVRSVYSAISSESAITGNSPRWYVVHDAAAALSGAIVIVEGQSVTLTWGTWSATWTNYSAGNPDWVKLKMNPDKFRISKFKNPYVAFADWDQTTMSIGAFSTTYTSPTGKNRIVSYFQVGWVAPASKIASVIGNFPTTESGSVSWLIKNPSSSSSTGAMVDSQGSSVTPKAPGYSYSSISLWTVNSTAAWAAPLAVGWAYNSATEYVNACKGIGKKWVLACNPSDWASFSSLIPPSACEGSKYCSNNIAWWGCNYAPAIALAVNSKFTAWQYSVCWGAYMNGHQTNASDTVTLFACANGITNTAWWYLNVWTPAALCVD